MLIFHKVLSLFKCKLTLESVTENGICFNHELNHQHSIYEL